MYSVFQIVNWLRVKNNAELNSSENAEELIQMKAMKLLYYIQAASLVVTGKRMFNSDIVAWKYGPAVAEVHAHYIHKRSIVDDVEQDTKAIEDYKTLENDHQASDILNSIYEIYGHSSAYDLMRQTHREKPWQDTPQSEVISDEKIKNYFKNIFVINNED